MSSFFGIDSKNGIFGGAQPAWVDPVKPAGCTDQRDQLGWPKTIANVVHGRYMFWNPNMVWFTMALALHVCAPYNIEAAKAGFNLSVDGWVLRRLALNFTVGLMYYGFFYVALYVAKASTGKGAFEVMKLLRDAGGSLDTEDQFGITPKFLVRAPRPKQEL